MPDGVESIITKIKAVDNLADLDIEEVTQEGGIADNLAKQIGALKITQLRRIFDSIKKIETAILENEKWDESVMVPFAMLRPNLANAYGRGLIPKEFYEFIKECLTKIICKSENGEEQTRKNFRRFVQIMESLVAYHRYYHPKGEGQK